MAKKLPTVLQQQFQKLRMAARELRTLSPYTKTLALHNISQSIAQNENLILKANAKDLKTLPSDTTTAFRDRLTLNKKRLEGMIESLNQVAKLPDPLHEVVEERILANGLKLKKVRAPLGVIFMIFESRPNVILEAFSLAFKSGNAIALRGGSESKFTAQVFYRLIQQGLEKARVTKNIFLGLNNYDREIVKTLLQRKDWIDIVVPRGGEKLIDFVQKTAQMPIIKNDRGLCHAYVDDEADLNMAVRIVENAKTQRPGVCNSLETVLVHKAIAKTFLPQLFQVLRVHHVTWHCDQQSLKVLGKQPNVTAAKQVDWDTEYLDQIINCRVVDSLDEAIHHIEKHGSHHSEAIVTRSEQKAREFQARIDAAAVYWNASTRFTDGFEFGLGGELGISTQKLHVRGPVGLRELTCPRWIIDGDGQIRD